MQLREEKLRRTAFAAGSTRELPLRAKFIEAAAEAAPDPGPAVNRVPDQVEQTGTPV